ncbi:MAG: hypothetical protein WCI05_00070 [Myxococcales bacterium]
MKQALVLVFALGACGGAGRPASAPAVTTPAPPAAPAASVWAGGVDRGQALEAEINRTSMELELAVAQCLVACRALASMERAVEQLCVLSEQEDERCKRARERLVRARDLVMRACGTCVAGQ